LLGFDVNIRLGFMKNFFKDHKSESGFTLVEILIVIGVMAIIAVILYLIVDPKLRFAESRNSRRQAEIKAISDAVGMYIVDHNSYPPGIDDSVKMIGKAGSGCEATCGRVIARIDAPVNNKPSFFAHLKEKFLNSFTAQAATTTAGWVTPTGFVDAGNQWDFEARAYDGNTSSYAQNSYAGVGWGQFIELTLAAPILSDRLRIKADYLNAQVQEVDVDVFKDGAWVDAYLGGSEAEWNGKYFEVTYPKGTVSSFRFRYNYLAGGYYYWLYEAQVYESALVINPPVCQVQNATAIQRTAAILHGLVFDDGGEPCEYRFNYGQTTGYGISTAWTGSQKTGDSLSKLASGLEPATTYHFQAEIRNSAGVSSCADNQLSTRMSDSGWVLPSGHDDPYNKWENPADAYDDLTSTFAMSYHGIGAATQSDYLYFTHEPISSDKVKFFARGDSEVDGITVDVLLDSVWTTVYNGPVNNLQWMEASFTAGVVSEARVSFSTPYANHGFFWEIYEFVIQKSTATTDTACLDLSTSLTPDYIPAIPYDPLVGSDNKTYYAISRRADQGVTVIACQAELGEYFETSR